jgi:SH3-like domain-containing protein
MSGTLLKTAALNVISSHQAGEKQRLRFLTSNLCRALVFMLVLGLSGVAPHTPSHAREQQIGPVSKLPLPRYASLKSDKVNLREGPTKDHRTKWIYQRAGLPVEIIAEFENWRRIRDSEGTEGWVFHSLLTGRRTALVAPWLEDRPVPLYARGSKDASVEAQLLPGVLANIKSCSDQWCRISGDGFDGYIEKTQVWGVYPDEPVD